MFHSLNAFTRFQKFIHCNHSLKLSQRYEHDFIRVIVCCSAVSFGCHVTCCIVMFCRFPLLTVGDILLPVFFIVRICSSTGVVISRVLTVGATLFSIVLNIQATKYSSHHISSFLTVVNCLSHPIYYGANCSSHHVVSFFTGVNGLSHPMSMVLYCSSHHYF